MELTSITNYSKYDGKNEMRQYLNINTKQRFGFAAVSAASCSGLRFKIQISTVNELT